MDAIATSVLDTGGFWPSDRVSAWEGAVEDDVEDDLQQGIGTWEGGSLSFQESGEDIGYGYSTYGYGTNDEWGTRLVDPDIDNAVLPRRGEKRRSDSLSGDGFDRPETPNSPLLQGSSVKGRSSGTGSLFFKTKLCIKFKAGTCPYNSSCNFAHGMDELRKPPPGWEDMVGVPEGGGSSAVPLSADSLRFRRTRRCKKYYSEEGCPYGERCNFLHDDQAKARESNAISLGPGTGNTSSGGGGSGGGGGVGNGGSERPSNWKTRMCNKWEMTGHCPFGQKCNFAHGPAELQMYAGAPVDADARTTSGSSLPDSKQVRSVPKSFPEVGLSYVSTTFVADGGHNSNTVLRQRSTYSASLKSQKQAKIANWKGPSDEISTIYGDWIEEDE